MKCFSHTLISFALLGMACGSHSGQDENVLKSSAHCNSLKEEIQQQYDSKNYSKTIELFKLFENCFNDKSHYLGKLGLLYKLNGQLEESRQIYLVLIERIDEDKQLSENENALSKAGIYIILDELDQAKVQLERVEREKLTKEQQQRMEFFELIASQGEFVSANILVDVELFD